MQKNITSLYAKLTLVGSLSSNTSKVLWNSWISKESIQTCQGCSTTLKLIKHIFVKCTENSFKMYSCIRYIFTE